MNYQHLVLLTLAVGCGGSQPDLAPAPAPAGEAPAGEAPAGEAPAREAPAGKLALSGTITFEGTTTATALFVSVKDPANPGPPLAAKQLPPGPFPMTFTLTDADVVQMGPTPRGIPANVALTVRLDGDGNAMTKDPADPVAVLETPATAADLAITLAPAAQ